MSTNKKISLKQNQSLSYLSRRERSRGSATRPELCLLCLVHLTPTYTEGVLRSSPGPVMPKSDAPPGPAPVLVSLPLGSEAPCPQAGTGLSGEGDSSDHRRPRAPPVPGSRACTVGARGPGLEAAPVCFLVCKRRLCNRKPEEEPAPWDLSSEKVFRPRI